MAFGKRTTPGSTSAVSGHGPDGRPTTHSERVTALRDEMRRINREAATLAELVREGRTSASRLPFSDGIVIDGLAHCFDHVKDGKRKHSIYVYLSTDGQISQQGQVHLFDLTSRIVFVNSICRSCADDEELRYALLAPEARASIDFVLAVSAFFAAYFTNTLTAVIEASQMGTGARRSFDFVRMRDVITECLAAARTISIDPASFTSHVPMFPWPMVGVALEVDDHEGQAVLNEVYLPSDLAGQLAGTVVKAQPRSGSGKVPAVAA